MDDLSSSLVALQIEKDWLWWSGYPRDDPADRYWCWLAKTDGPEFYTETAFPSFKPDIDIFGVPRRSRKQRGWYQVVAPSLGRPNERLGKRAYFRALAKPSNTPPELFDGILQHSPCDHDRHTLGCASVRRYWGEKCRTVIFGDLSLNSREDVLLLLELMRTPTSSVSSFIKKIYVREAQALVSGIPWLHLVPVIVDQVHKELYTYKVSLKGPLPAGQRMRSIHHKLPRSLPAHFSRRICTMLLTDVHFKKLDDLMHLVSEMCHLWDLECERVTWGSLPTALPRRRPRNESPYEKPIKMSECGPCPVEASVWLAASVRPRDQAFFSLDNFTHTASLARGLESGASTTVMTSLDKHHFYLERGGYRQVHFYGRWRDSSSEWGIASLTLDIRKREGPVMAGRSEPDWTIVGRALSSFTMLKRMIVGLDSREDMLRFEEQVAQVHLRHLSGSGVLRYALWDPAGGDRDGDKGNWLRASLNSDDTEPSGCHQEGLDKVYDEQ